MASFRSVARTVQQIRTNLTSREFNKQLGEQAKDIIFKRVKQGFGVDDETSDNPKRKRLKRLSQSYIEQRKRRGVQGSFGGVRRSNLTLTGQLLESMIVRVRKSGFTIIIPDTRRRIPRRGQNSKGLRGAPPTNADVAIFVSEAGRQFFALTGAEKNILIKTIRDRIRRFTRRIT